MKMLYLFGEIQNSFLFPTKQKIFHSKFKTFLKSPTLLPERRRRQRISIDIIYRKVQELEIFYSVVRVSSPLNHRKVW
jgi:hypothetical protein